MAIHLAHFLNCACCGFAALMTAVPLTVHRFFSDTSTFSVLLANRTYRPFVSTSLAVDYALAGEAAQDRPAW
jgi:hypothetical protein